MKRCAQFLVGSAVALLVLISGSGSSALASTSGPCTGAVNSIDVTTRSASDPDDAIRVGAHDDLDVVVTSAEPIGHYQVQLSFAGFRWTVAEDDADGTSWTKTVAVKDYSRFGVGLYQVHVVSGGSSPCEGSLLIRIGGSPFASIAGWVMLTLTGLGVGATTMVAVRRRKGTSFGAIALGAVGGLGAVGLLQQFSLAVPTRPVVLLGIGLGATVPRIAQQVGALTARGAS